ncbi:hypothetical protein E4T47_08484 [Aureobasidium subglaciale]|nr:hypothetical protein E4T47_08484 [Aureobasidium subglaciale]
MRPHLAILAVGLFAFVRGQVVGNDNITTVSTATCLSTGTQTYAYVDPSGIAYRYQCGAGSGGTQTSAVPSASVSSWQACFAFCDNLAGCNGFTYNNGAVNGNGPGQCILKAGTTNNFASTATLTATRIAGLQVRYLPKPIPSFSCPQQDQQTVTDLGGQAYVIQCAHDLSGGSGPGMLLPAANNFNDCFASCDSFTPAPTETQYTTCNGFAYSGVANGAGPGNCYLKYATTPLTTNPATNTNNVGAIRVAAAPATATTTLLSAFSSSSSASSSSSSSVSSSSSWSASSLSTVLLVVSTPTSTPPANTGLLVGSDGITTVATATCTTVGTQIYAFTDSSSTVYQYMCGGGSGGALLVNIPPENVTTWQDCFNYCENTTVGANNCTGFNYVKPRCTLRKWTWPMSTKVWQSIIRKYIHTSFHPYCRPQFTIRCASNFGTSSGNSQHLI